MFLYFAWEFELIKWLQEHSNKITDFFFNAASLFGEEIILIMVVAVVYWCISKDVANILLFTYDINRLECHIENIFLAKRPFEYEGYGIINNVPQPQPEHHSRVVIRNLHQPLLLRYT